ncbi:MAG: hypothetical protein GMKNLPBB_01019 [Myxococcota bacterium]|nr:hypothetical protein [Myxococcota bacterium]
MDMTSQVLVMTVGTGDPEQQEETLFKPMRESIKKGEWKQVILLPSKMTEANASRLKTSLPNSFDIFSLPGYGDEDDVDRCYQHFVGVLRELVRKNGAPHIVCDFTRGTKAMSAALLMAAIRCGAVHARYVTGEREGPTVKPGAEIIHDVRLATAMVEWALSAAESMLNGRAPSAAMKLLEMPGIKDPPVPDETSGRRALLLHFARMLTAWNQFDYRRAIQLARESPGTTSPELLNHLEMCRVPQDSDQWDKLDCMGKSQVLEHLIADMIENARRCCESDGYEDALLRLYRATELIGQARLFREGLDSGNLNSSHPAVRELIQDNKKPLQPNDKGVYQAARLDAARLLTRCDNLDSRYLGEMLKKEDDAAKSMHKRNLSVLNHGYQAQAPQDQQDWEAMFQRIEGLFRQLCEDADVKLNTARFPNPPA